LQKGKITFSFGRNWERFLRTSLTEERIQEAQISLMDFLGVHRLDGLTFLDVGCGSGLFSLAAHQLGARKVTSFDLDPFSVVCCEYLKEHSGNPETWTIRRGSILDKTFLSQLEQADLVYSWGVLHHTGSMWQAIDNTISLVRPGGMFFVGLYNKVDGTFGSRFWLRLKRTYNRMPMAAKLVMEYCFLALIVSKMLFAMKNPISEILNYKKRRGMSFRTDIRDSLGGYPYEYASVEDVFSYCKGRSLELMKLRTVNNLGLNEFLFRKSM